MHEKQRDGILQRKCSFFPLPGNALLEDDKVFHLVRPADELDEIKSKRGSIKDKSMTKAITEIYLTRLLSVKVRRRGLTRHLLYHHPVLVTMKSFIWEIQTRAVRFASVIVENAKLLREARR